MGKDVPLDGVTLDEAAARLGNPARFPWLDVSAHRMLAFVAEAASRGCGVTFGTLGYGVLGSIRVQTADGRTWRGSYHEAEELDEDLRVLGSEAGMTWVLEHAEKPGPRRRR